jgi:ubiquitin-protein ligase
VNTSLLAGCFVFDILLPPNYPDSPPKFQLLTTGGGKVRFNPNLYADGKVCLSILGTWSGPAWIPGQSSLCQVLISIQSFILGESQPYGNEPGYERMLNTADGKKASEAYNRQQRYNTLAHSMLPALKKPPFGFEQAVKLHYTAKKEEIKAQIEEWREMEAKLAKSQSKKKGHHHHRWHERETANVGSFDDVAKAVLAELDELGG